MNVSNMRVEPELPDHPKYIRLKIRVGDYAMEALIRLWGHCQHNQRGEAWTADAQYVEVVCRWTGEPGVLYRALKETGFLHEQDGLIIVHEWNEQNRQFLSNWKHGTRGGRPRKPNANHLVSTQNGHGQNDTPGSGGGISKGPKSDNLAHPQKPTGNRLVNQTETDCITDCTKLNLTSYSSEGGTGETGPKPTGNQSVNQTETNGLRYDLAREALHFLNEQAGTSFPESPATLHLMASRLAEVKNDLPGVKQMLARMVRDWSANPQMKNFLRPSTLFQEEKFPDYYGQRKLSVSGNTSSRREELQDLIDKSPANRESAYHRKDASAEEKEKLRAWREELRGMQKGQ